MRPTFMGFETATRGLMASQKSIDIVNNNITNIGTTGYTRQRADLVSLSVNTGRSHFAQSSVAFAGQGATVYGVSQIRDAFLDKRFREEYADVGYYKTTSEVLGDLHNALDEISPSTMSEAMSDFKTSWNDMLQKNSEQTNSANVLSKANSIVAIFQQMSSKIDNVWNQQEYNLEQQTKTLNTTLKRVAELNEAISQAKFNCMSVGNENYQPLELLDERNVLLDQLSGYGDMTYKTNADGMVDVLLGGHLAVSGKEFQTMAVAVDKNNPDFKTVNVYWNDSGEAVKFNTGSIRGNLDMLNGRGVDATNNSQETNSQGILYFKEKVDQFARTFMKEFNNLIETCDSSGNAYVPPQYKTLFTWKNDDGYHGASTIQINDQWNTDSTFLLKDILDKAKDGQDTNGFASKAVALFDKKMDFGEYSGTMGEYIEFYSVMRLSNSKEFADNRLDTAENISNTLLDQIQQKSGVSFDEEGVDLMMHKKAYDAMSRVFTTLDEMLDKLINSTGTVGR